MTDPDLLGISRYVKQRRIANRLSQQQLGKLCGVGTRFISELERGKPTLRIDTVNKVLAAFNKQLGIVDLARQAGDE